MGNNVGGPQNTSLMDKTYEYDIVLDLHLVYKWTWFIASNSL